MSLELEEMAWDPLEPVLRHACIDRGARSEDKKPEAVRGVSGLGIEIAPVQALRRSSSARW